jgi:ribonuclease T2
MCKKYMQGKPDVGALMIRRILCIFYVWLIATPVWADALGEIRGAEPGAFEYYVLALSWSPSYCHDIGDKNGSDQCRAGINNNFVIHGLWPQNVNNYPTECTSSEQDLPKTSFETATTVFPDLKLAEHEWRRHGTCTARKPLDYLADTMTARQKIVIPTVFQHVTVEGSYSPNEIENAFLKANPGLEPSMMSVACSRGELQEVRICFTKTLDGFRACPELKSGNCRAKMVRIPPEQ